MDKKVFIDYEAYQWLLTSINKQALYDNSLGQKSDLDFIKDETWLTECAVIEHITKRKGTWCVDLVFASFKDPMKLLIRKITSYSCKNKATLHASIFRRQAAKDQRGTIHISIENYKLIDN